VAANRKGSDGRGQKARRGDEFHVIFPWVQETKAGSDSSSTRLREKSVAEILRR
jgi:hypothetical protein